MNAFNDNLVYVLLYNNKEKELDPLTDLHVFSSKQTAIEYIQTIYPTFKFAKTVIPKKPYRNRRLITNYYDCECP